jgi:aldose 1-epimerase
MTGALEIVRLGDDELHVEVLPAAGARLHRIRVGGVDVLRTPDDPARHRSEPWFWGSYPLAPWCNRIPAGPGRAAGRAIDLPSNFPDGTAIHGQVAEAPWTDDGDGRFRIRGGGDGWPWPYDVVQRLTVTPSSVELTLELTNLGDDPMPGGLGIHPWFRNPVDLTIRAASVHPSNLDPSPMAEPVAGDRDRRTPGPLAEGVDAAWTDLGDPPVELAWPADGLRAVMTASPNARYIVAARLAGIDGTAVEPNTHAPAGLRRLELGEPGGLELIGPGDTLAMTTTLAFSRLDT